MGERIAVGKKYSEGTDERTLNRESTLNKYSNAKSIFGISFLFHLLFIFQGLDVTDLGYHLTHQVYAFASSVDPDYVSPIIFLTDFMGGMWLSIVGEPSVLWARLGGVLLFSLSAALVFSILADYFEKRKVFLVVLVSSLFVTMRFGICIIDYFTFPAFLINIELWMFNQVLKSPVHTNRRKIYSFLLGFATIPIVLSRCTLVLFLIAPLIILAYYMFTKRDISGFKRMALFAGAGFIFSVAMFGFFYQHIGLLSGYVSYCVSVFGKSVNDTYMTHGMGRMIRLYLYDFIKIVVGCGLLIIGLYMIAAGAKRLGENVAQFLVVLIIMAGIATYFSVFGRGAPDSTDFLAHHFLKLAIGVVLVLSGIFLFADKGRTRNLTLLLLIGLVVMLITPIGSASGLLKSFYGMWLILPLSILCAYKVQDRVKHPRMSSMMSLLNGLLVALLILSLFFHATNVYRDDQNRLGLNTEFSHRALWGIYSTPDRVKAVDDLLEQIHIYSNRGDVVLIINNLPLIYYLTETKPALGGPWLEMIPESDVVMKQRKLEEKGIYPKLFICAKVDTEDRRWPCAETLLRGDNALHEYMKDEYLNHLHYSLVWENKAFAIYGRLEG
jgi:hypothetical protein